MKDSEVLLTDNEVNPRRGGLWFLYLAFFLSGFSGLIYESQWSHYLKIFLGHSAYAQVMVLGFFMGGMFIGAWLMARLIHRIAEPLKLYVYIELAIGAFGFFFHPIFKFVIHLSYTDILPALDVPWQIHAYKWLVGILLIAPQTILLGMTFPLMVNGILRRYPKLPGNAISSLYFVNSFGAAIGVLVAAFYLMLHFGLPGTMLTAAIINCVVVFIVLFCHPYLSPISLQQEKIRQALKPSYDALAYLLLLCALATGMASFIYEISWIRMLSMVLGASTHAFELMLSAFILGLALGALFIRYFIERIKHKVYILALVQIIMGTLALTTIMLYSHTFYLMQWFMGSLSRTESAYGVFNLISHGVALFIMLPTTFCAGMTLPLMTAVLVNRNYGEKSVGDVYAWNMIGSILGISIAIGFGLTWLGLKDLINFAAFIDVLIGVLLLLASRAFFKKGSIIFLILALASFIYTVFFIQFDPRLMASGVYRTGVIPINKEIIFHKDGRTATVAVEQIGARYTISTNGKPDATVTDRKTGSPTMDEPTQILLGAFPLAIMPNAEEVAVIGFGSGSTSNTLLEDKTLKRVDTIEIEPAMVEGAKQFKHLVPNVFEDPRSHIIIEDAKTFFSTQNRRYDLIIAEPSNPWVSGVASLFTYEFYKEVKKYLKSPGYFVQWMHLYEINDELIAAVLNSIGTVFENYEVYETIDGDVVIIASDEPIPTLSNHIFKNPRLRKKLEYIKVYSLDDLKIRYTGSKETLVPFALVNLNQDYVINSDYKPMLEFLSPKARFMNQWSTLDKINQRNLLSQLEDRDLEKNVHKGIYSKSIVQVNTQDTYRAIVENKGKIEIPLAIFLLDSQQYCLSENGYQTWFSAVFQFSENALAYLSQNQQSKLWPIILPKACLAVLPPFDQKLVEVILAMSQKNYSKVAPLAYELIDDSAFKVRPLEQRMFIIRTAMLADIKNKQYRSLTSTFLKKLKPMLIVENLPKHHIAEFDFLYAYAVIKANESN
ncbi:spermidine synthase [Legionella impletisoli]|uniref:PABS domain-containing protein n=1 Tax=Legionella impletisoli TaxID=343510 RepID=A0A917JQJ9_9GAMM|nr:spermidine synthase [Legionella impletisoli]GGI81920.1 hypothetical protein GCM10007966_08080 [Legionella impletisoli]